MTVLKNVKIKGQDLRPDCAIKHVLWNQHPDSLTSTLSSKEVIQKRCPKEPSPPEYEVVAIEYFISHNVLFE